MSHRFAELMFTPRVKSVQEEMGSRASYARLFDALASASDTLGPAEWAFLAARDSFYVATVTESGWPYVQHRGGPIGFVKVLDASTIGFADYRGNRQYISTGNLRSDDRVSIFLMDYPNRRRLKLLGHARAVASGDQPDLMRRLVDEGYPAVVERAFIVKVEGFDWNCPQHITPRFSQTEVADAVAPLHDRIRALEQTVEALRK